MKKIASVDATFLHLCSPPDEKLADRRRVTQSSASCLLPETTPFLSLRRTLHPPFLFSLPFFSFCPIPRPLDSLYLFSSFIGTPARWKFADEPERSRNCATPNRPSWSPLALDDFGENPRKQIAAPFTILIDRKQSPLMEFVLVYRSTFLIVHWNNGTAFFFPTL